MEAKTLTDKELVDQIAKTDELLNKELRTERNRRNKLYREQGLTLMERAVKFKMTVWGIQHLDREAKKVKL